MALRLASSTCRSARFRPRWVVGEAAEHRPARPGRWRWHWCWRPPAAAPKSTPTNRGRSRRPGSASPSAKTRSPCSRAGSRSGPNRPSRSPRTSDAEQPRVRSNAPLDVVFVAANLTDVDSRLEVRGRGADATSKPLVANGAVTLQAQPPDRRLHGQRRRRPRRQARPPRRRPVPHLLRERRPAAPARTKRPLAGSPGAWRDRLDRVWPSSASSYDRRPGNRRRPARRGAALRARSPAPARQPSARPRSGDPGGDLAGRLAVWPTCCG